MACATGAPPAARWARGPVVRSQQQQQQQQHGAGAGGKRWSPPLQRVRHRLAPLSATRGVSPAPPELAIPPWLGSPEQEHALAELRRRIAAGEFAAAASDDATLRWFLLDRRLDVDAAEHKLLRMLQWRQQIG